MEGRPVRIAKTGYTGEPIGYELCCESRDARYFWDRLIELRGKTHRARRARYAANGSFSAALRP
ncbi:MAG: hypothetical protein ACLU3I_10815 [Acutalibacteraceae bacterium]